MLRLKLPPLQIPLVIDTLSIFLFKNSFVLLFANLLIRRGANPFKEKRSGDGSGSYEVCSPGPGLGGCLAGGSHGLLC